ncbi:hypothetical protein H4R34_004885 [Dimargaris verticillata]|uniref:General transcription and DNA repair factor IIH n=1 Tax=Dimargaris verticillata TaxID=2761393 RepID=A0A9W8AXZ3_9FUNG|nr:hypothetical protein H4R34_004885 [Dimargaris verticillata]
MGAAAHSTAAATAAGGQAADEIIDIDDTLNADNPEMAEPGLGYAWEEEYKRSWEGIREDEQGSLAGAVANLQHQKKRRRRLRDTQSVQRGIIRHLVIILDASLAMNDKDLRPSRMELALSYLEVFIAEYFDQNPLSQLGVLVTRDAVAEKISELGGNPLEHIRSLHIKRNTMTRGEPSLQNALEIAMNSLSHAPSHGTREILLVFGSLTSCDPGNIQRTVETVKTKNIRCSMVHLAAEVHIFRELCDSTHGQFSVAMNEPHFKDLLLELVPPPPVVTAKTKASELIRMGFPMQVTDPIPTYCACHNRLFVGGYICPRCKCKVCELPTDCNICNLTLVSSPHLARSYHHLFPVNNFKEVPASLQHPEKHCHACLKPFKTARPHRAPHEGIATASVVQTTDRYECPKCRNRFCLECDLFIHDVLRNCPGCTQL